MYLHLRFLLTTKVIIQVKEAELRASSHQPIKEIISKSNQQQLASVYDDPNTIFFRWSSLGRAKYIGISLSNQSSIAIYKLLQLYECYTIQFFIILL